MAPFTVVAAIAAAVLPTGCGTTFQYSVARGASGKFPFNNKSCRPESKESASRVRVEDGRFFDAVAAGSATINCAENDSYVFDIKEVARISLEKDPCSDGYLSVELTAYARDGTELYLGDSVKVAWAVPPTMEQRSHHGDIIPMFHPGWVLDVRPDEAGDHRVVARFAGHEAAIDLDAPTAR
jgi:hypothetical protein